MANEVFANNMEVSCKAADGKSICAFPDVCFTPPQTPATPPGVPIPYPNTGMASDCTDGSSTVKISGREVMLKNKSYFKRSMGDEAGCAPKKGVITSKNMGKVYFIAWSMDVKVEGENVVRNMDMTTHNHGSTGNTGPQIYLDRMAMANIPGCETERQNVKDACEPPDEKAKCPDNKAVADAKTRKDALGTAAKGKPKGSPAVLAHEAAKTAWNTEMDTFSAAVSADPCQKKLRCLLSPYSPKKCCPGQTPHHLVEAGAFHDQGRGGKTWKDLEEGGFKYQGRSIAGTEKYDANKAPCICVEGESQHQASHKLMHEAQNDLTNDSPAGPLALCGSSFLSEKTVTLGRAQSNGAQAVVTVFPDSGCDPGCIEAQLKNYHEKTCGMAPGQPIRAVEV
ncbi:PAAR-like domain-containing protein [Caldimonas brevitalea]|uniref:Tox-GHH2 domain-containing protein n=1 Tax=Caldimonas brevitalea TaxID=413882 RepID=A0A0G3BJQ2_9BURK|nr:PAAR-like domain-containing protein [Caldimonas brevitalea]AKJ29689.1 hypothetical protein AAW51_2998 [Caldimonas brevitalea]